MRVILFVFTFIVKLFLNKPEVTTVGISVPPPSGLEGELPRFKAREIDNIIPAYIHIILKYLHIPPQQ